MLLMLDRTLRAGAPDGRARHGRPTTRPLISVAVAARARHTRSARCARIARISGATRRRRFRSSAAPRRARSTRRRSPFTPTTSAAASRGCCAGGARCRSRDVYAADWRRCRGTACVLARLGVGGRAAPPKRCRCSTTRRSRARSRARSTSTRLDRMIEHGRLRALAVNATSYRTGQAVTFFQGTRTSAVEAHAPPRRALPTIGVEHLMASTAIPFIFPAARLGDDYYMDGSVRQIAPLSPALHLGARRLLVIAVGPVRRPAQARGAATRALSVVRAGRRPRAVVGLPRQPRRRPRAPGAGQPPGRSSLPREAATAGVPTSATSTRFVLAPSQDLGELARDYVAPPAGVACARCCAASAARRRRAPTCRRTCCSTAASAASCSRSATPTRWRGATRSPRSCGERMEPPTLPR